MANTNEVHIEGWVPFDVGQNPDALTWLGVMNTPSYGLRITYGPSKLGPVNEHGGHTTFYRFWVDGTEAIWQGGTGRAVEAMVRALRAGGAEIDSAGARDLDYSDSAPIVDILALASK